MAVQQPLAPSSCSTTHRAVLRLSASKLEGSGSRLTTVASGKSSLKSAVEKPALAPVGAEEGGSGMRAGRPCRQKLVHSFESHTGPPSHSTQDSPASRMYSGSLPGGKR